MDWRDQVRRLAGQPQWNAVAWLTDVPGLRVYVRASARYIEGQVVPALDLASVEADVPGDGAFTQFLPQLEALADELGRVVYVENVLQDRFQGFFVRRKYNPLPTVPICFWRARA